MDGLLIIVDKMKKTDLAVGQCLRFVQGPLQHLLYAMGIGKFTDLQTCLQQLLHAFAMGDVNGEPFDGKTTVCQFFFHPGIHAQP